MRIRFEAAALALGGLISFPVGASAGIGLADTSTKGVVSVMQDDKVLACASKASDGKWLVLRRKGGIDVVPLDLNPPVENLAAVNVTVRILGWAIGGDGVPVLRFPEETDSLSKLAKVKQMTLTSKDGSVRKLPFPGKAVFASMGKMKGCGLDNAPEMHPLATALAYRYVQGGLGKAATANLGFFIFNGQAGFQPDIVEGGRILHTLSAGDFGDNRDALAAFIVSSYMGKGVAADPAGAFAIADEYAKPGDIVSHIKARMLRDGIGVTRDVREAKRLFTEVAETAPGRAFPELVPLMLDRNVDGPDEVGVLAMMRRNREAAIRTVPKPFAVLLATEGVEALPELKEVLSTSAKENPKFAGWLVGFIGRQPWISAEEMDRLASDYRGKFPEVDLLSAGVRWDGNSAVLADRPGAIALLGDLTGSGDDVAFRAALALVLIADTSVHVPDETLAKANAAVESYLASTPSMAKIRAFEEAGRQLRAGDAVRAAEAMAGISVPAGPTPGFSWTSGEAFETYGWRAVLDYSGDDAVDVGKYREQRVHDFLLRERYLPPSELVATSTSDKLRAVLETAACGTTFGTALQCGFAGGDDGARDIRLLMLAGQVESAGRLAPSVFDRAVAERMTKESRCGDESRAEIYKRIKACSRIPDPAKLAVRSGGVR